MASMVTVPSPTPVQQTPPQRTDAPARRRAHPRVKSKTCNKPRNCSPHRNQQYSIIALTNGGGSVTERYAYSAYGTPTITNASGTVQTSSSNNNCYTYTGREWDSGLSFYHYRARMYDSVGGRFCSRDPIGFEGDSLNIFQFLHSNPVVNLDPSGLKSPYVPQRPPRGTPPTRGPSRRVIGPYYPDPPGWKNQPDHLLYPLRCAREKCFKVPEPTPNPNPHPFTHAWHCEVKKRPCAMLHPGVPICSFPFIYKTSGEACVACNGDGYRPGRRPKQMTEPTDGIVNGVHVSCEKTYSHKERNVAGDSIVCGTCCIEGNGEASLVNRCKCAPQRDEWDDDDDYDYLYD
jgi:RHS repeat-associated protein